MDTGQLTKQWVEWSGWQNISFKSATDLTEEELSKELDTSLESIIWSYC